MIVEGIADLRIHDVRWLLLGLSEKFLFVLPEGSRARAKHHFNVCFYSLRDGVDIVASGSHGMRIGIHSGNAAPNFYRE